MKKISAARCGGFYVAAVVHSAPCAAASAVLSLWPPLPLALSLCRRRWRRRFVRFGQCQSRRLPRWQRRRIRRASSPSQRQAANGQRSEAKRINQRNAERASAQSTASQASECRCPHADVVVAAAAAADTGDLHVFHSSRTPEFIKQFKLMARQIIITVNQSAPISP